MGGIFSSCTGERKPAVAQPDDCIELGPTMRTEALQPVVRGEDDYRIPIHWSPFSEDPKRREQVDVTVGPGYDGDDDYP
jgi:hypothetical protein